MNQQVNICEAHLIRKKNANMNKKYLHDSYLTRLLCFKTCRAEYFLFFSFYWINYRLTYIDMYMINKFIYKNIKMSRSGSYMKSPSALYKKAKCT